MLFFKVQFSLDFYLKKCKKTKQKKTDVTQWGSQLDRHLPIYQIYLDWIATFAIHKAFFFFAIPPSPIKTLSED